MALINKSILIGSKSPREGVDLHHDNPNVKADPYCAFRSDVERRKALGTRDRWRSCSFIAASMAVAVSNSKLDLPTVLAWFKQLSV